MKRKWIALSGAVLVPTAACIPLAITANKVYKLEDYDVEGKPLTWNPYDDNFEAKDNLTSTKSIINDWDGQGYFQEIEGTYGVVGGGGGEIAIEKITNRYKGIEGNFKPMGLIVQQKTNQQANGGDKDYPYGSISVGFSGDNFSPVIKNFKIENRNFKRLLEEAENNPDNKKTWQIYDNSNEKINPELTKIGTNSFIFEINKDVIYENFYINETNNKNSTNPIKCKILNPSGMKSEVGAVYNLSNKDVSPNECYTRANQIAKYNSKGIKTTNWPLEDIKQPMFNCGNINAWYDVGFNKIAIEGGFIFNFTEWLKHLYITITRKNNTECEILISEKEIKNGYQPFWYMTYWKNEYLNISIAEGFRWTWYEDEKEKEWRNKDTKEVNLKYGISNTMGDGKNWLVTGAEWGKMPQLKKNSNGDYEREWWKFIVKFTNPLDPSK